MAACHSPPDGKHVESARRRHPPPPAVKLRSAERIAFRKVFARPSARFSSVRRIAVIFLVAVFVPSLLLGFLALRTAGEQRAILERQASDLYQKDTNALASTMEEAILGHQREFADRVRVLLSESRARALAADFSRAYPARDNTAPFVIAPDGSIVISEARTGAASRFLRENEAFLSNRASAEYFPTQQNTLNLRIAAGSDLPLASLQSPTTPSNAPPPLALDSGNANARGNLRTLQPQSSAGTPPGGEPQLSQVAPRISDFQTATSTGADGVLARYARNALELILWTRPPEADGYVFGLALPSDAVHAFVRDAFAAVAPDSPGACIAVLDEGARPVALSHPNFRGDWKRPFVASEIGEALPHWETAVYLLDPAHLARDARLVTIMIVLLIALALAAIMAGGGFVAIDTRRQLDLAQKKTDFVSNVSHELKTPLTSIRMFAELLEQGRVEQPDKRSHYLRIIILESERLTRLINNVLDFARSGRKAKNYRLQARDLLPIVERAWEAQTIRLREEGFRCDWTAEDAAYPVVVDADAIGQILVNLLSNAEKYAGDRREVSLRAWRENGSALVSVEDRGIGVPPGDERHIFEAFHRSNDSLAASVQGTGLGLTLARGIARDHGGEIEFHHRTGGGSTFTLRLPIAHHEDQP